MAKRCHQTVAQAVQGEAGRGQGPSAAHVANGGFMMARSFKLAASQILLALTLSGGIAKADTLMLYTSQPEADAAKTVEAFKLFMSAR